MKINGVSVPDAFVQANCLAELYRSEEVPGGIPFSLAGEEGAWYNRSLSLSGRGRGEGRAIPEVSNIKILGIFSKTLSFTYYFTNLQMKCLKKLNAVRVLASTLGGARTKFLINIINSTIRSSLEYGCQVFLTTNKTDPRKLEVIYNQGLRFACGLPKWSPIPVTFAEANEPPLRTRLQLLAEKFVVKQAALKFGQLDLHRNHNQF
ncbi:hypothetical protein JTE90_014626 [Oedothorax gibbosus]|uniref:Uncharacterized protein n=1 Tax=Oedothorax gibbosus TaxID=931172 RepID=A0AAV6V9R7_9ARAC|nr:hypothetical protein JTE90_014626 [Oedothorax gibbosus]